MPTYAYACKDCGHQFDIRQSFSDEALTICPECDGKLRKKFNTVGISFKGSGFYSTDSRAEKGAKTAAGSGTKDGSGSKAKDGASPTEHSTAGSSASGGSSSDSGGASSGSAGSGNSTSSSTKKAARD